jgi:TolB-like protein/DNA-binding winged helix-turn-helix (wHTH) protein
MVGEGAPIEVGGFKIGPWTVRPALNLLVRDSRSVRVEPRAMDVLAFLAARAGAVVSVEQLIAAVWKGVVVGDSSVYVAVKQLRRALDESADGVTYIETIPKRGYRLTVPVERAEPPSGPRSASEPEAAARPTGQSRLIARKSWRRAAAALAGVVLLLICVAVSFREHGLRPSETKSVAVLPFDNLSSEPEQAYFADGVTEEILSTLSGIPDLHVIGRASSFHFKGRKEDLPTIARMLDVEHVLEGSVRKAGDRVRISAQLSNARTAQQLWSETYERKLDDVFEIQDEIASSVARALQIKLGVGDIGREPGMTRNVAAYDEYLRGRALNSERSYAPAIAHLQRAVALDPSFSVAWSGLHGVYANGALAMPVPQQAQEWQRQGAEALERARALTPDAPHVLLAIAIREARRGNWLGAAPLYDGLQPAYAKYGAANQAWAPRGVFLMYVGRAREAIPALERARAEDPLAPGPATFLSQAYLARGDVAAALTEIDRGIKLQGSGAPPSWLSFWIAMNQTDRVEIERRLRPLRVASDSRVGPSQYYELARFLDSPAAAESEIRRLAPSAGPSGRILLSLWAAYFHAPELSLELIAREATNGEAMPVLWQPLMRDVRKLPAFKDLVRASGLLDYWRAYGWSDFCRPTGDEDFACS